MIAKLRLAAALTLLLSASPAFAWVAQPGAPVVTTSQILSVGAGSGGANSAADRYFPVGYAAGASVASDFNSATFPVGGAITGLLFHTNTQPAGAATFAGTLLVNGSATAATCTVTSSSTNGTCSWTGSVAITAGDKASFITHPSGSPTTTAISASFVFAPTTANDSILVSAGTSISNSATWAQIAFNNNTMGAPTSRRNLPVPDGGTIDRLFVTSTAPGAGTSYAFTHDKNATAQSPTCTISDTATACNDTSNSFAVTAGDDIQIQSAPTNTPTSANASFGARFRPTTTGRFIFGMAPSSADSATAITYYPLAGGGGIGQTTEGNAQIVVHAMTIEKVQVKLNSAPGTGETRRFTVRKNGADQANCDVVGTATTASCAVSISFADGDLYSLADNPVTGGDGVNPVAAFPGVSLLVSRP